MEHFEASNYNGNADTSNTSAPHKEANPRHKFVRLPLARVKHMMKKDPDCGLVAQDAVFLITKATEMFIEYMGKESYNMISTTKRKTVLRRDVDSVIQTFPNLCFLDGALEK